MPELVIVLERTSRDDRLMRDSDGCGLCPVLAAVHFVAVDPSWEGAVQRNATPACRPWTAGRRAGQSSASFTFLATFSTACFSFPTT